MLSQFPKNRSIKTEMFTEWQNQSKESLGRGGRAYRAEAEGIQEIYETESGYRKSGKEVQKRYCFHPDDAVYVLRHLLCGDFGFAVYPHCPVSCKRSNGFA